MNVPALVQRFTTGVDALAFFQQNPPPDLIVSDWVLPMLAFPDFVTSVRNLSGYAQTPIALVTSADPTLYRKEAEQLGILCCLQKPVDPPQLQRLFDLLPFHFSQTA